MEKTNKANIEKLGAAIKKLLSKIKPKKKDTAKRMFGIEKKTIERNIGEIKKFWRRHKKILTKERIVKTAAVLLFSVFVAVEYFQAKEIERQERQIRPLKEKIGQMLMIGFRGTQTFPDSYIANAIAELNLGGVILFDYDAPAKRRPRNITDYEQTKKLVADLKSYAKNEPLMVAVDAEGGMINRLKSSMGFAEIDSAQNLGKRDGLVAVSEYWTLAKQLRDLGININFAPVVDINVNPKNPVIGGLERSYSQKPQVVADYAKAFVAAHRAFGILTSLKHFPGHGSSDSDSHLGLPDVTESYEDQELDPYKELIKNGAADSIMTAHVVNREIDANYPATLSPNFIEDILRRDLEFGGVVFSDDMQMGAIVENYGFEDAVIRAINAGCDILIFSNNGAEYDETVPFRARDIILQAVIDGRVSEQRINESFARITKLKEKLE